jgi:hypothetical protein
LNLTKLVYIDKTYQFAVLESIEHLKITAALKAIKVRNMLPEAIDTSESKKPLRVNSPCISLEVNQKTKQVNHTIHTTKTKITNNYVIWL